MLNRRLFMQSIVAAATVPAATSCATNAPDRRHDFGPLVADPNKILDLPAGFRADVVSVAGTPMNDGLKVPPAHDGMAAFPGDDGRIVLVCNHEMNSSYPEYSAFGTDFKTLPDSVKEKVYDWGGSVTPGAGGTTTSIYNPATRETEQQYLSLAGTEINCAGGATPWGSWLSCEESFGQPGTSYTSGRKLVREERHGYVFEVRANAGELQDAVPLKDMGRFEHEAAAVHEASGIVYMTEDRYHSLFYRFIPNVRNNLREGGRLQALAIADKPSMRTHNWGARPDILSGQELQVHWIDLDNVDSADNNLRLRGARKGAAMFARGEGLCVAGEEMVFTCTIGGRDRRGQVFSYTPSVYEGSAEEVSAPGTLRLIAESTTDSILQNGDNLTMAPWGDLVICEDTTDHCGLVGITPDGEQYALADNPYSDSELAGACFSPDGSVLFINIQYPGMTIAITGPWPNAT